MMRTVFNTAGVAVMAFCLVLGAGSVPAQAADDRLDDIRKSLEQLNARIDSLEAGQAGEKMLREDVDEIFERLDRTERKTLTDKMNFGFEFRTRYDNFAWTDTTGTKNINEENHNVWSNRFRLRMSAEISETLLFHGRMSVYKRWADVDRTAKRYWDANSSELPSDNTVRLDRAYVDLLFPDLWVPLAFTVGRQPTVGGPPEHIKDLTEVRSTFPSIAFEREVEGVNLTLGLSRFTGLENSALRIMYGKFLQVDNDDAIWTTDKGEDVHLLWLQAESDLSGDWHSTKAMLTYLRSWNYPGSPYESVTQQAGDLGYHETYSGTFFAEDFLNTGLAWFATAAYSKTHGSGDTIRVDKDGDGTPETYGLLSPDGNADREGYAIYLGARLDLPIEALHTPKLGLEFNHGSRYWWTIHAGTEDPADKLATRGNAWEAYYIQPLMKGALLRFGAVWINYDYRTEKPPLGTPPPVDQRYLNTYVILDVRF